MRLDIRVSYTNQPGDLCKVIDRRFAMHAVILRPNTPLAEFGDFDSTAAARRALVIKHPRTKEPLSLGIEIALRGFL